MEVKKKTKMNDRLTANLLNMQIVLLADWLRIKFY